jgi:phosphatidylinositol alpha-1,6-mannosyltransferase
MRRWLLVTEDFPPTAVGGIAAWAEDLAGALAASGEAVTVLARRRPGVEAWDRGRPYPVIRMAGRSWGSWQGLWAALAVLPRLGPGVVVLAATWRLVSWIAPLVRILGATLLVSAQGSDLTQLERAPGALRRVAAAARAWVPVSRFLGDELGRLGISGEVFVLPMALQAPPAPAPASPEGPLVVIARLLPSKGVDRVLAIGRALGRPVRVVGDGPAAGALRALGGAVQWMGALPRDEARAALIGASALLLLPRSGPDGRGAEGLGLCLLEAAAAGVPVIGCFTGGVPEATGPGLLLDDPEAPDLNAIRAFLGDPASGALARAWVLAHHGPAAAVAALRAALG